MATDKDDQITQTEQNILNKSQDTAFKVLAAEILGYDGVSLQRMVADALAVKITVSDNITYIGIAAPGTAQGEARWQCKKIDETTGVVITWADGNADFDNVATDLTALSYS